MSLTGMLSMKSSIRVHKHGIVVKQQTAESWVQLLVARTSEHFWQAFGSIPFSIDVALIS